MADENDGGGVSVTIIPPGGPETEPGSEKPPANPPGETVAEIVEAQNEIIENIDALAEEQEEQEQWRDDQQKQIAEIQSKLATLPELALAVQTCLETCREMTEQMRQSIPPQSEPTPEPELTVEQMPEPEIVVPAEESAEDLPSPPPATDRARRRLRLV